MIVKIIDIAEGKRYFEADGGVDVRTVNDCPETIIDAKDFDINLCSETGSKFSIIGIVNGTGKRTKVLVDEDIHGVYLLNNNGKTVDTLI